jgi:hypothetical protein
MIIFLNVILTLLLGITIGLNINRSTIIGLINRKNFNLAVHSPTRERSLNTTKTSQAFSNFFDTLEERVLSKILETSNNGLHVKSLNELINLTNLSAENQRQRRHLFLKELNLKLFLMFGVRESIIRLDDSEDKRVKIYKLSEKISQEMIEKALKLQV